MKPLELVKRYMYDRDAHSKNMGISIVEIEEGRSVLALTIKKEHTNGFDITHGGLLYTLADTAMAFASGSYGYVGLTIEGNINYIAAAKIGDTLKASTVELSRTKRIAVYSCTIINQEDKKIATAKATIFIKDQAFD